VKVVFIPSDGCELRAEGYESWKEMYFWNFLRIFLKWRIHWTLISRISLLSAERK